jgi:hypothetical protein
MLRGENFKVPGCSTPMLVLARSEITLVQTEVLNFAFPIPFPATVEIRRVALRVQHWRLNRLNICVSESTPVTKLLRSIR